MTSVASGNPQRFSGEEPGLSYSTRATLQVPTALGSRICQEGDALHVGNFRSGDTCHFRRAAGLSDVAGESARSSGPGHGTVRWLRGSSSGTENTAAASGRNRKCHVSPLCLRGRRLRPGPPSLSGFGCRLRARRSRPRRPDSRASPRRVVAAGGLRRPRRHASALTRRPLVFRFSGLQLPCPRRPRSSWLGAAVDPDDSVLP